VRQGLSKELSGYKRACRFSATAAATAATAAATPALSHAVVDHVAAAATTTTATAEA